MSKHPLGFAVLAAVWLPFAATAQVPQLINYQGRVAVGTVNFDGAGQFKFALVNTGGTTSFWSNDGTSTAGSQPANAVSLTVTKGLYQVLLGDTTLANMTAIPNAVFSNSDVRLRVWFNDGTAHGWQQLTPDQRIAAVGYAMMAAGVELPATTGSNAGVIQQAGAPLIHSFGTLNFFAGGNAGNFTLSGYANTGIGSAALEGCTSGGYDTAAGAGALDSNNSGWYNTAFGAFALSNESSGMGNIAIGFNAGSNISTGSNNIDIGASGAPGDSGIIRIGNGTTQTDTYLTGTIHGNGSGLTGISGSQLAAGSMVAPMTVSGTTQTAAPNTSYVATSSSDTSFSLPTTANVGDQVQITGAGTGGWSVANGLWTQSGAPRFGWSAVASSADGTRLVATTSGFGGLIYTSANSGLTWTLGSAPSAYWSSVASSADGIHCVAVAYQGGIYTSSDSGATWTPQTGGLPASAQWGSVASSADGRNLVAVVDQGWIYTSTNFGVTWTEQFSGLPLTASSWLSVASSADGVHLVAVISGGRIYTSANSGVTWTQSGAPIAYWSSVASSALGSKLVAVSAADLYNDPNTGLIYTSTNSGATWTPQTSGLPASAEWGSVASSADGAHLVAASVLNGIYTSSDSGATWTPQSSAPTAAYWASLASSSDGTRLVAAVQNGPIYTTSINGAQGTTATLQYLGNGKWAPVQPNGVWQANGSSIYYIAGNVGIGASTPTNPLQMGSGAYCSAAGVWTNVSDRNVKECFTAIAPGDVLDKVAALPITQWKYKIEPDGIKHLGPVAQDFHAAFGLGDSDRAIGSVDEAGVALAAIQGLNRKLEEQNAKLTMENAAMKEEIASQAARDKALENRLSRLEQAAPPTQAAHGNPAPENDQSAPAGDPPN